MRHGCRSALHEPGNNRKYNVQSPFTPLKADHDRGPARCERFNVRSTHAPRDVSGHARIEVGLRHRLSVWRQNISEPSSRLPWRLSSHCGGNSFELIHVNKKTSVLFPAKPNGARGPHGTRS